MGWGTTYGRHRVGYWQSIIKLLAHLLGTAIMFVAILLVSWGLSYLVHKLHLAHPFPDGIYDFVTKIELWLVYIDVIISGIVLVFGAWKFLMEMVENWQ